MFAYCNNNPANYYDDSGSLPCQNTMRMSNDGGGARSINGTPKTLSIVYKIDEDEVGTRGYGINLNAAFGIGFSVSAGITYDKYGNIGFIFTAAGGGGMASFGVSGYHSITNAPTIYHQEGMGMQTGGSAGEGVVVGLEYSMLPNIEGKEMYHGITGTAGVGWNLVAAELHAEVGYTWVWGFNINELFS